MMNMLWVVLFVALTGTQLVYGLPVGPTPPTYPHDANDLAYMRWSSEGRLYAAVPALALVLAAVGLLFGCTWCYRHKDCKQPNQGADNQLFTASATHLHEARRSHPPDSGFSEPVNNNISEDNNNGPISLREMQNIANNNAGAYIVSENEERNRISRESVVEFEPLPNGIQVLDPLEHCADWFGVEDFPRNQLQYLREMGRGWFGRVVEGEIDHSGTTTPVAVQILNQNASLEDKARFLDEARVYRDVRHENTLAFVAKCLQEDPWILIFEFCSMDLQQYLVVNRPKMAILNESGVPLRLMCDVTSALAYLHSRGYLYGNLWSGNVLVRGTIDCARAVLGRYSPSRASHDYTAPESSRHPPVYNGSSEVWSLGTLIWEVCAWGSTPSRHPPPLPELPCPYRNHLYQVMQLCWNPSPDGRPTSSQVHALVDHLHAAHAHAHAHARAGDAPHDDGCGSGDFEERWQRLKPNSIPKIDEHVAIIHAPSTSMASHFTGSDHELDNTPTVQDTLSIDMDTAVSRSSSIMSDKDPLSVQVKSESLTNLHGSLEDVRNIYLTHNEMAVLECHQGNMSLEDSREREQDRSDSSVDPWLKDIMAGSQDDVSYYKDVSDVIKNLDNILNSEKTSSSESSHQASPSRDNLSLDCKRDYPMQSSMVKSPGINNFQNILETGFNTKSEEDDPGDDDDVDRDTVGTLSHSFERHSDSVSQQTLENLTPETPTRDGDIVCKEESEKEDEIETGVVVKEVKSVHQDYELPKDSKIVNSDIKIPELKELCVASMSSVSDKVELLSVRKDCQTLCDNNLGERTDNKEITKSIDVISNTNAGLSSPKEMKEHEQIITDNLHGENLPISVTETALPNEGIFSQIAIEVAYNQNQGKELVKSEDYELIPDEEPLVTSDLIEIVNKYTNEPNHEQQNENKYAVTEIGAIKDECISDPIENIVKTKSAENIDSKDLIKNEKADFNTFNYQAKSKTDNVVLSIAHIEENCEPSTIVSEEVNILTEKTECNIPMCNKIHTEMDKSVHKPCLESLSPENTSKSLLCLANEISVETISHEVPENKQTLDEPLNESLDPGLTVLNIEHEIVLNKDVECEKYFQDIDDEVLNQDTELIPDEHKPSSLHDINNETLKRNISNGDFEFIELPFERFNNDAVTDIATQVEEQLQSLESSSITSESENNKKIACMSDNLKNEVECINLLDGMIIRDSATKSGISDVENDEVVDPESVSAKLLSLERNIDAVSKGSHETVSGFMATDAEKSVVENNKPIASPFMSIELELERSNHFHNEPFHEIVIEDATTNCEEIVVDNMPNLPLAESEHKTLSHNNFSNKDVVQEIFNTENTDIEFVDKSNVELVNTSPETTPESVQNIDSEISDLFEIQEPENNVIHAEKAPTPVLPPDKVQNNDKEIEKNLDNSNKNETTITPGSDYVVIEVNEQSSNSTVYMDLVNSSNTEILKDNIDDNIKDVIASYLDSSSTENSCSLIKNESTVYLDLPSLVKETDHFLNMERRDTSRNADAIVASTPLGSDGSADNVSNILESSPKENENLSETKVPNYAPGVSLFKLEQTCVPENMSPFESPTKSHHTDTFDENSSVVLGPFENCSLELFRVVKSTELVDLPKEELLAFSSNFSEINLETPSPLRDGNFLNEVPDIMHDDFQFDDIATVSEGPPAGPGPQCADEDAKSGPSDPQTESNTEESGQSVTEKHISPLTPPNSPGVFLASSQQNYLVDIDLTQTTDDVQDVIDLNQIELQITSKLAMAENENNLNIEYSGPLTVEGMVGERESDAIPESFLAGNGGSVEDVREGLALDEECVQALRNELELKLPLAQVSAIEPPGEGEWALELPPPPELVVSYPGALSPIAEETGPQLCAYENDAQWNASTRTDSSESYPEPCNNSMDEVTDLPTAAQSGRLDHSTYTLLSRGHSPNNTFTVQRDVASTKELTMSVDSLNASPQKNSTDNIQSPIDDRTYNKNDDEKESICDRISQVSPFLLSPTTDTSAANTSDNVDNATGVSTLSKTTAPTDAKLSKPTECLSKATSIDSWCSNDTLYNVEENFDDLAMDPDLPTAFAPDKGEANSDSTDTLTHDDERELSRCSTYIIHGSKSEACLSFSPDSITANDNNTYTKVKTEPAAITPSVVTKSEADDSTKNTQTKDLAYGTLVSGLPSYSNCTSEVASAVDDSWKLLQPELVRKSPMGDNVDLTPPNIAPHKEFEHSSPQLTTEPCVKKMDSVEISCLQDNLGDSHNRSEGSESLLSHINDSPTNNYRNNMAPSITSTPLTELTANTDNVEAIPMQLPQVKTASPEYMVNIPNFQTFQQSAEVRPQDLSSNASNECVTTEILLEGDSKTLSRNSNRESLITVERTPTYSDFENSAVTKPQDVNSKEKSSHSIESGVSSEGFRQFENSVRNCPQDLSSMIDASSLLLRSERMSSEIAMGHSISDRNSQSDSRVNEPTQSLNISPPNFTNLIESHSLVNVREPTNTFLINFDVDDEMEQPHSIIITETPFDPFKDNSNITFDSHAEAKSIDLNYTYDSHTSQRQPQHDIEKVVQVKINGEVKLEEDLDIEHETDSVISNGQIKSLEPSTIVNTSITEHLKDVPSESLSTDKPTEKSGNNIKLNRNNEMYATVNFLNESFEELIESNVDDGDIKDIKISGDDTLDQKSVENANIIPEDIKNEHVETKEEALKEINKEELHAVIKTNGSAEVEDDKMSTVTEDFLQNEKRFCQLDSYLPLMSDIKFTGPATENIMSTSFTQDSPTDSTSPECEQDNKPPTAADIIKEWDSDSDSHSTNSSSGEFIWKDGDGHETSVVPSTYFDHQRDSGSQSGGAEHGEGASEGGALSDGSGDSGSGLEGDEVEFVPSSWDCRAAPSKSSLRSLEQATPDNKKRVVFKRQKYHCVYEYPREASDADTHSPAAYLPDLSTYCEWEARSAEAAELGYGQLFGARLDLYPDIAFGPDYDEDFFISSSARPFESLGVMSTTSQFFPGMHVKPSLLDRDISDDVTEEFPPPPSPLPTTLSQTRTPSLDFTTPDSGVEDITPGSTIDEDFRAKKLPESELTWRPVDSASASSSESVSPSSPGGEALGGLRHTRDKLKLDLPPSPHIPSPRHNRVFNFVLDKPKRRPDSTEMNTPLVMTDDTPVVTTSLPLQKECEELPGPEPTFSTFGKNAPKIEPEQKIILTDDVETDADVKEDSPKVVEPVKGEGTVLDSGDEDSGIESSSKTSLERNKTSNVS